MIKIKDSHKELALFTILNYIDKGLSFILPFIILFLTENKLFYNDIEYIYSIENILIFFFTFLVSSSYYFYREYDSKEHFLKVYQKSTSILLIICLFVVLVGSVIWSKYDSKLTLYIIFGIIARTMYMLFINSESSYYRLIDHASRILLISILINILSIIAIVIADKLNINLVFPFFGVGFISSVAFVIIILNKHSDITSKEIADFYKKSLYFAWPIIITCFIGAFVNNAGKIIAFNKLSTETMYVFSFTLRISLIIQLAHSSIIAYYSKNIYLNGYTKKLIWGYIALMMIAVIGCILFTIGYNIFSEYPIPITKGTWVIYSYTFIFCCASFMEMFFGSRKKNHFILLVSMISGFIFCIGLYQLKTLSLLNIGLVMLLYAIVRFVLYVLNVIKIKRNESINYIERIS